MFRSFCFAASGENEILKVVFVRVFVFKPSPTFSSLLDYFVGPGHFRTFKMVGKMGETCPQCKQFRMLCMCAVTSDRDRKGRQGRRMSTERALAFAQSLAVWKRRSRRPRGPLAPSRQSSLRTIPNTPSMIAAGKSRITFSTTI